MPRLDTPLAGANVVFVISSATQLRMRREERRGKDHSMKGGHSRTKGIAARTTAEAQEESRRIMTHDTRRSMMKLVASSN